MIERNWRNSWAIYVLRLGNGCFYVGSAADINKRLKDHSKEEPKTKWIKINSLVGVAYIYRPNPCTYRALLDMEDRLAIRLAKTVGANKVRGGKLSGFYEESPPAAWSRFLDGVEPLNMEALFAKSHSLPD